MFTDIVHYAALICDDKQQAVTLLKKNRLIQKLFIEDVGGEGYFGRGSRLQTFLHKMKFPE